MTTSTEQETTVKTTVTMPTDREIHIVRIFKAPRERVWQAMTDPKLVAQWWGRGNKLVIEKFELERGGHWRFVEHSPEGVHGFEGRFREVTPPKLVVQTFEWDGWKAGSTRATRRWIVCSQAGLASIPLEFS